VASGKTDEINYKFRFYCTYPRHLRCFSEFASLFKVPHNVLVWQGALTYISLYNSSLLSACLCLVAWAVFSFKTVQMQRKSRLHFHCTTRTVPEIEHTISKWGVIAFFLLCQAGLFIDRKVKSTNATAADPREYLCLDNSARWVVMLNVSLCPGYVDSAYKENTSVRIEFL